MSERIQASDIQAKLQQIQDEVTDATGEAKPALATLAAGAVAAVAGLAYVIGSRKARRQTTVVEIRRV